MWPEVALAGGSVRVYSAALIVGYALGVAIPAWLALRDGRRPRDVVDGAVLFVISCLLGAKLFHVLFEAEGHPLDEGRSASGVVELLAWDPLHWARLFDSGYVLYGGVVVSAGVMFAFARSRGVDRVGAMFDYAAPALAVGLVIGRLACFAEGCCYGTATAAPWAVSYPTAHPTAGAPVHPVQLYEAAFAAALLAYAAGRYRRRAFEGELLMTVLGAYAGWRFAIESIRGDAERGLWLEGALGANALSTSQIVSVAMVLALVAVAYARPRPLEVGS